MANTDFIPFFSPALDSEEENAVLKTVLEQIDKYESFKIT